MISTRNMKKNVAKKIERKRGEGKKVTGPQVPVFCYMYIAIAYWSSVRNVATITKILLLYSSVIVTTS
jgi:hypothetical protein